jgi:predicted SprT family Zn-dependent metalloprotease
MSTNDTTLPVFYVTREEWLNAFTEMARPVFEATGNPLPLNLRISVGFSSGGSRSRSVGECWTSEASGDGHYEIFLAPTNEGDARIADILTHELCHAAIFDAGHGPRFKALATAIGLTGKSMKATVAGPNWHHWAAPILKQIGSMPYAPITASMRTTKKKKRSPLVGITCEVCERQVWATRKNFTDLQAVSCIDADCDGIMHPHYPDEDADGEG